MRRPLAIVLACALAGFAGSSAAVAPAQSQRITLPTGQTIAPLAAAGATMQRLQTGLRSDGSADAGGAMATALSPDGRTLLVLTSGYNYQYTADDGRTIRFPVRDAATGAPTSRTTELTQWIFIYRVANGKLAPVAHIAIPNAFCGIAWAPGGREFYVSGGTDDSIVAYAARSNGTFVLDPPAIGLGHRGGILAGTIAAARAGKLDIGFGALAAGIGVSADGRTLAVANMNDDSVSIVDLGSRRVRREVRLFVPGSDRARGEYPFGIAVVSGKNGDVTRIYAGSMRDGDVTAIAGGRVSASIALGGEPNVLLASSDGSRLYVANGDLDEVEVIDTASNVLLQRISVDRPNQRYRGANPNGLALDERAQRLYVTLGTENAVAVVDLASGSVVGRIPTGWYPTALSVAGDRLLVADAKAPSGPNPGYDKRHHDRYVLDLEKANVLDIPIPSDAELASLSATVDENNGFGYADRTDAFAPAMRGKIRHVIFIMKENRTYDQVLGDLPGADGDPSLTAFPYAVSPNHHELAKQFVTFDNFYTSGDVSSDGWNWSTQGRANEYTTRVTPISYASDGFSFDTNGTNRSVNTALPSKGGRTQFDARVTTLLDPTGSSAILPGSKDVAATQGDSDDAPGATGGYIWDAVLRAGLSVRQYGMYVDPTYYALGTPLYVPVVRDAYARGVRQAAADKPSLQGRTDVYYRGWDLNTPDRYRFEEWKREFDGFVTRGDLPSFEAVTLMMDHFGHFGTNAGGLDTPVLQMSDDDYALGRLVEAVANSRYWKDTAIFVMEDDSQDGPDHVDSHRSPLFVISAYTRRHTVVHTHYSNGSVLRTIEDLLGLGRLGMFDRNAADLTDALTSTPDVADRYAAVLPGDLCTPPVHAGLIPECATPGARRRTAIVESRRPASWWIARTQGMNFDRPDAVDPLRFNRLLEEGL